MPKPPNPIRGEIKVSIGQTDFVLIPEWERYAQIQGEIGCGVMKAADRLREELDMGIAVSVLALGSRTKMEPNAIAALIMESGGVAGSGILLPLYAYLAYPTVGFERASKLLEERGTGDSEEASPEADEPKSGGGLASVA